ncbi:hypothetical protein ACES2I_08690 [Bdellovibrio bacteriovorus]|uniref:hypothetical protein n=1 Tax=Bdellovibrio bacteriovorus TaxID=959 RepID=UPI0035A6F23A
MNAISHKLTFPEASAHIVEAASWIGRDLSSLLKTNINRGNIFAVAPSNVSTIRLRDLKSGGLTPPGKDFQRNGMRVVEKRALDTDFAKVLKKTLESNAGAAVVGFDVTHLPDPIETDPLDLSIKPFGIFNATKPTPEDILEFINEYATAWTTVIMVVDHPTVARTLKELSETLLLFGVAAYDGESFIYWSRL